MKKIGLIAAMQKELMPFLKKLNDKKVEGTYFGNEIYSVSFGDKKLYIIQSGVGEIAAAAATQLLISEYRVDTVLNFGVCGAYNVAVNTPVIVNGVIHYEIDTSAIDGTPRGKYDFLDSLTIPVDKDLVKKAKSLSGFCDMPILSGNLFVDDKLLKTSFNAEFNANLFDMEAAGIALTCYYNHKPCLLIKAVSDSDGGAEEFKKMLENATKAYIDFLFEFLEKGF